MIKKKLGILGGGQILECLFVKRQKKYKIDTIVFSNSKKFSAKKFCDSFFIGDFNDENIKKFINSCDFITIETENIPKEILKKIEYKKKLFPSACVVEIAQNRLKEKNF